jgi:predicted GNAT family acetyltransferase
VDGKATEAAMRAVAEAFSVRRGDVTLVTGATSRDKVVEISGDDTELAGRRDTLLVGTPLAVTDNEAESRFEIHVGDELAGFVRYHRRGELINLIHTEVDPKFQGAGLAARLARASLDSARERHLDVLPSCPYITSWIRRHQDYLDLVPEVRRPEFGL